MAKEASERELLPLGSVVELEGRGRRPFMVYGRMVEDEDGRTWDYLACAHPEGHMPFGDLPEHWFANREHVSKLLFVGYQGGREAEFLEYQRNNVDGSLLWDM